MANSTKKHDKRNSRKDRLDRDDEQTVVQQARRLIAAIGKRVNATNPFAR